MLAFDCLTEQEILERVDEYSLYCFYLEFEPIIGKKYPSRVRIGDDRASFGVFARKHGPKDLPHEFMWKDQGLPTRKNYGDVFDLISVVFAFETRLEALIKVCTDFGLMEGASENVKQLVITPVRKEASRIRVKTRPFTTADLQYWRQYNITEEILTLFNVRRVQYFFLYDSDLYPRTPKGPMYAYKIFDKFQLYQPNPKMFFMDWTELCIPGFAQLRGREFLVITKSFKDVMFLYSLGCDAVGARAENMIPSKEFIEWARSTYKKVFVLFDNDGKSSAHLYPFEAVYMPEGTKDPTDHCSLYGLSKTVEVLKTLFNV